ncbi:peroxisomal membrane protein 11B-like [Mytilus trossulus]
MSSHSDLATQIVKFGAQTNGRDKLFRLLQYGSKLISWYLQTDQGKLEFLEKLKKLETSMSMTRKLLRFGKSLDFILSALKTIHLSDPVLKLTITMSKLAQSVFLIFDHIIFAHNLGIIKADKEKWSRYSSQCWLFSLTLNLLRNSYDILSIISNEAKAQENRQRRGQYVNGGIEHSVTSRKPMGRVQILKKCCYENQPVVLDFVKNMSDLVLPLNSLGKIKVSGGIQGSLGLLSSAIGIATVWSPILKLVP